MVTNPQIVRALGDLEGTVRSMADQWRAQEAHAADGRQAVANDLRTFSAQIGVMSLKLDGAIQDVAELKNDIMPTIDAYKAEVSRKIGAMSMGKLFWALMVAMASAVGFMIHEVILYFGSAHH